MKNSTIDVAVIGEGVVTNAQLTTMRLSAAESRFENVPIKEIDPTPNNPRRFVANEKFHELVRSIKEIGIKQPILIRTFCDGSAWTSAMPNLKLPKYEIIAGERRWRAAKEAGLETVPAIISEMSDEDAFAVTVIENLLREDLHPLDEAAGIEKLLGAGKSIEDICAQIGKSRQWVMRRANLSNLIADWRATQYPITEAELKKNFINEEFDDEEDLIEIDEAKYHPLAKWSAAHLELVSRYDAGTQSKLYDELTHYYSAHHWTLKELEEHLGRYFYKLETAQWPLDDRELYPEAGACLSCLKRSSCKPDLFDGVDIESSVNAIEATFKNDTCLDEACWKEKRKRWIVARVENMREKNPDIILIDGGYGGYGADNTSEFEGVRQSYNYDCSKKPKDGYREAVYIKGDEAGQKVYVKPHNESVKSGVAGSGEAGKLTLAEKRERLHGQRVAVSRELFCKRMDAIAEQGVKKCNPGTWTLALALAIGIESSYSHANQLKHFTKKTQDKLMEELMMAVAEKAAKRIRYGGHVPDEKALKEQCEIFEIDYDELWKEAVAAKPEPKSWKAEEAAEKAAKQVAKKVAGKKGVAA